MSITGVLLNVLFKVAQNTGVSVSAILIYRYIILSSLCLILFFIKGRNPFREFPWDKKQPLFWRLFTG